MGMSAVQRFAEPLLLPVSVRIWSRMEGAVEEIAKISRLFPAGEMLQGLAQTS